MLDESQTSAFSASVMRILPERRRRRRRWYVLGVASLLALGVLGGFQWNSATVDQTFSVLLDADDLTSLKRTLSTVIQALEEARVTYFMTSGTLLGSYRHHGHIPWDDDVDLMVNSSDKELIWTTLTALFPEYGLFLSGRKDSPYHWKFYPRYGGRRVPFRPFRWPFVDLLFFVENSTHVWNGSPNLPTERWPRRFVFPLRRRPFDNLLLPAPCDTEAVLAVNFDVDECHNRAFSHIYDLPMFQSAIAVPCSALTARYPFVLSRRRLNASADDGRPTAVSETLSLGNGHMQQRTVMTGC